MKTKLYFLFLFLPVWLFSQQYNFQSYPVAKDGLSQSQVYAMLEDHNGYLWMGTRGGGLNRFDGRTFEHFTVDEDDLINNNINTLYEANGLIYIGANNGMSVFDGRTFKNYFISKEEEIAIRSFQWHQDRLLVGTNKGVYEFDGDKFNDSKDFNNKRRLRTDCFFKDSKNRLWVGTRYGAILYDELKKTRFNSNDDFTANEVTSIAEDKNGNIWFGTYKGAYVYNGKTFENRSVENGLASNNLIDVSVDQNGLVWMASLDRGISIWDPIDSTFTKLNAETGLCSDNIRVVLEDSWGSTWIGTSGGGVCKYVGQQFLHRNISNRAADNLVYAVCQDSAGSMWFAAANDGVVRLDSIGYTAFGAKEGFANTKTKAMLRDKKDRLWFGTNDNGLAYFNGQSFEFLTNGIEPIGILSKDIVEDETGKIWVASATQGVYRIEPRDSVVKVEYEVVDSSYVNDSLIVRKNTLTKDSTLFLYNYEKIEELNININDLHFDRVGRLWFASRYRGIGYYNENGVVTYTRSMGLPTNDIRSIAEDEKGHLWIGTAGFGLARINIYTDSLNLQLYTENDGLSSGNIYLLEFDNDEALWVGCGAGIDRLDFDEEQNIKSVKSFGKADGFLGGETCQNAALKDNDGNLWFGTIGGVTKFLPGSKGTNNIAPKLQIKAVELFGERFENTDYKEWIGKDNLFTEGLKLPHHQNKLSFEFFGINLANPQKVEYQWMLEGDDKEWSKKSLKNYVNYTLGPGDYTLKVKAFNEDLVYNDPPLEMSFCILSPIWQRWWFIAGAILLLGSLIGLIFKTRLNQIRRKAKQAQEKLEMENNLLQLEQKALQLQMNPHFIFNALNTVQSLFMSNEQGAARQLLSKFAKLMRAILENSRASVIPLQNEIDLLDNYLAIEQFSRPGKFDYTLTVDPTIDPDEVNIPPMLIQPFVENAIIHGVNPLKHAGQINLSFKKEGSQLVCSVEDNGVGRQASAKLQEQNARKHKSVALDVTEERLEFLNQDHNSKSLVISDLKNDDGSIAGTKVLIKLPLEEW